MITIMYHNFVFAESSLSKSYNFTTWMNLKEAVIPIEGVRFDMSIEISSLNSVNKCFVICSVTITVGKFPPS